MAKIIFRPEIKNDGQSAGEGEQGRMIPIPRTAKASKDDKFEVNVNGAWFAAELAFKDGVTTVHFDGYSDDDERWNTEEIKSYLPNVHDHIRVVSEQLQDAECRIISLNQIVCAFRKAKTEEGWYDALVTEVRARSHMFEDDGEVCTCLFSVIWRDGPDKGQLGRNLVCADICVPSNKNVEAHPLVADILSHANCGGSAVVLEEEVPRRGASTKMKERKSDTDDDLDFDSDDDETDDYTPSLEEQNEASLEEQKRVCLSRRRKSKAANLTQDKEEISADPNPREQSELATQVSNHPASTSSKARMRGLVSANPHARREQRFDNKCFTGPFITSCEGPLHRDHPNTPTEDAIREQSLRSNSSTDPPEKSQVQQEKSTTGPPDTDCKPLVQQEKSSPRDNPTADDIQEQSLRSNSSTGPPEKSQVQQEKSSTGPPDTDCKPQVEQEKSAPGPHNTDCKPQAQQKKSSSAHPDTDCKHQPQKENSISSTADELKRQCPTTKVFVDLTEEDAECEVQIKKEHVAKADPISERYIKRKLPEIIASANEAQRSKKVRITVDFDIEVEPGGSISKSFAGARVTSCPSDCEEPVASVGKSEAKREPESDPIDTSPPGPKDEFVRPSVMTEQACDSERDEPVGSSHGIAEGGSRLDPLTDVQEGWNPHLQNRLRNRSTFLKKILTKPSCVLLIDNLEVGVRPADLLEVLRKVCDKEKIQSVQVPPPHPQMNCAMGYVVFVDKASADAAANVLSSCVIVSAGGRPWIVNRQGQEKSGFQNTSVLMGDAEDGKGAGGFRVLTRKQHSEYHAGTKRQKVFEEHRKQARMMFQRHAREENTLDAGPD